MSAYTLCDVSADLMLAVYKAELSEVTPNYQKEISTDTEVRR